MDTSNLARLPIKLANGRIVKTGRRVVPQTDSESEADFRQYREQGQSLDHIVEDVSTGARFGRPAVANVVGTHFRRARIQKAKEEIASICQDILADPECSVSAPR